MKQFFKRLMCFHNYKFLNSVELNDGWDTEIKYLECSKCGHIRKEILTSNPGHG